MASSSKQEGDVQELRARARREIEEIERQKMQDEVDEEKAARELEFYSREGKIARSRVVSSEETEDRDGDGKGARFRSAQDVLDRIRWDTRYDSSEYVIGYLERFSGIMEMSVEMWRRDSTDEDFVPQHRIKYVKDRKTGEVVWDRERRIDLIFCA